MWYQFLYPIRSTHSCLNCERKSACYIIWFPRYRDMHQHIVCSADELHVPYARLEFRNVSPKISGTKIWNAFPNYIKESGLFDMFKQTLTWKWCFDNMLLYCFANGTRSFICNPILYIFSSSHRSLLTKAVAKNDIIMWCQSSFTPWIFSVSILKLYVFSIYCVDFVLNWAWTNEYWLSSGRLSHQLTRSCWLMGHRICYLSFVF